MENKNSHIEKSYKHIIGTEIAYTLSSNISIIIDDKATQLIWSDMWDNINEVNTHIRGNIFKELI